MQLRPVTAVTIIVVILSFGWIPAGEAAVERRDYDSGLGSTFASILANAPADFGPDRRGVDRTIEAIRNMGVSTFGSKVLIHVRLWDGKDRADVVETLLALGADPKTLSAPLDADPPIIEAAVPPRVVHDIGALHSVRVVEPIWKPHFSGSELGFTSATQSIAVEAMSLPRGWAKFSGKNIRVGIVSDSFNMLEGWDADVAEGSLPGPGNPYNRTTPVTVLSEGDPRISTDEGRAIAQIIHMFAPDAQLFVVGIQGRSPLVMDDWIRKLAKPPYSCDVIVDDVLWPADYAYQESRYPGSSIKNVTDEGVVYVTSATNERGRAAQFDGVLVDSLDPNVPSVLTMMDGVVSWLSFGDDGFFLPIDSLLPTTLLYMFFTDNENDVHYDFTLYLFDNDQETLLFNVTYENVYYGKPYSVLYYPFEVTDVYLAIGMTYAIDRVNDSAEVPLKFYFYACCDIRPFKNRQGRSIKGHPASASAITVTAYPPDGSDVIREEASIGPYAPVYWTASNTLYLPLGQPASSTKPDLGGIDGLELNVTNSIEKYSPFYGTSAAAPTVAALAVLMLEASGGRRSLTPSQVRACLVNSTGQKTWSPESGYGLVNGDLAIHLCAPQALPTLTPTPSATPAVTRTQALTQPPTSTRTRTRAPSPTASPSPSRAPTPTVSRTPSRARTPTASRTLSRAPTATRAPTVTLPPTGTRSPTVTQTPTGTRPPTVTSRPPTATRPPTVTSRPPTPSRMPTATRTATKAATPSTSNSPSPTQPAMQCYDLEERTPELIAKCPPDTVFTSVSYAYWGTPIGSCSNGFVPGTCDSMTALDITRKRCLGYVTCKISPSTNAYGNPCNTTVKRLAVRLQCRRSNQVCAITPERGSEVHLPMTLSCPAPLVFTAVSFASFGLPTGSCSLGYKVNATCHDPNSQAVVEDRCLGQSSCTFAEHGFLTDFVDKCRTMIKRFAVKLQCGLTS